MATRRGSTTRRARVPARCFAAAASPSRFAAGGGVPGRQRGRHSRADPPQRLRPGRRRGRAGPRREPGGGKENELLEMARRRRGQHGQRAAAGAGAREKGRLARGPPLFL